MASEVQEKYHWHSDYYRWERVDRVQNYRGCEICTISTHDDDHHPLSYHREYRVTYPSGKTNYWRINKKPGGNIKDLKEWIDFKISRHDPDMTNPV